MGIEKVFLGRSSIHRRSLNLSGFDFEVSRFLLQTQQSLIYLPFSNQPQMSVICLLATLVSHADQSRAAKTPVRDLAAN